MSEKEDIIVLFRTVDLKIAKQNKTKNKNKNQKLQSDVIG